MGTQFYRLVLGVLAVWRATHLLNAEDGPWDLVVRLRQLAGTGFWGGLLDCFYCLSLWIAAPAALFLSREPVDWLFSWLALSGGACLLERMTKESVTIETMPPPLEGEVNDVLRSETATTSEQPARKNDTKRFVLHSR